MRLSINNWPPLATHFLCLLLGTLIANWQAEYPNYQVIYHRRKALIPLPSGLLASSLSWQDSEDRQQVGIAKLGTSSSQPVCRIKPEFLTLRQAKPFPVLELRLKEILLLQIFFRTGKKAKGYRIFPLGHISSLPLCHEKPKVSYGSRN